MEERSHLVPRKVVVRDPRRVYQAIRYFSPEERKERIKAYLEDMKGRSVTRVTRYLRGRSLAVDVYRSDELDEWVKEDKLGRKWYISEDKKRYLVDEIRWLLKFPEPEKIGGLAGYIVLNPKEGEEGWRLRTEWTSEEIENRQRKKFQRIKRIAERGHRLERFRRRYENWLRKEGAGKEKQLGVVLALMDKWDVRVGSGVGGVEESEINIGELRKGMVVRRPGEGIEAVPWIVVEKEVEGKKKLFLRSLYKEKLIERLEELEKQWKTLKRGIEKKPEDKELVLRFEKVDEEKRSLEKELDIEIDPKWDKITRVGHYGATQLEARHVKYPAFGEVWLDFIGKSGKRWKFKVDDPLVAKAIKDVQWGKSGRTRLFPDVDRSDVAKELRKVGGLPKDIRTYEGTKLFVELSAKVPTPRTKKELKQAEKELFSAVAKKLNNTPAVARSKYVDPAVWGAWRAGLLEAIEEARRERKIK